MFASLLTVLSCIFSLVYGKGKVGMNLEGKTYYCPGLSWKNRFLQAMPWISGNSTVWQNNVPIDFDGNGYVKSLKPGQIVRSIIFNHLNDDGLNHYDTPGLHIFTYQGNCSGCQLEWGTIIDKSQQGRWILNFTHQAMINIVSIDPSNYPKNFTLVPSEWENNYKDDPWDPNWIKPLNETPFSALRFMDFLRTNGSPNKLWSKRTLSSNYTMGVNEGVAWEYIIDLVNRMSAIDPWINIPHLANNDYVQNLAELWLNSYKGDGVIHIEYSNECWNGIFECYHYMVNQSQMENISVWQWYGQRVCEIRKIFDNVYGTQSAKKLYSVLGTQEVNSWITNQELLNGNAQCVDGIAVAAYYCMEGLNDTQQLSMTQNQLFDNIESETTQQHYAEYIMKQEIVANNYTGHNGQKLEVIGYEGSWGCTPDYSAYRDNLTTLYNSMCHNPRVADTVYDNLEMFHNQTGGTLFNMFSYIGFGGQWGDWGHLEYQDSYNNVNGNGGYKFMGITKYLSQQ